MAEQPREEWRPAPEFEGWYEVSSLGRVRSVSRVDRLGRSVPQRLRRPHKAVRGRYLHVSLQKPGGKINRSVHRLVALAFIPPRPGAECVNHKNGDGTDNRVENLEWVTTGENNRHSFRVLGRTVNVCRGASHPHSSAVRGVHVATGEVVVFASAGDAGRAGFSRSSVTDCLAGRRKTHGGYSWSRLTPPAKERVRA